MNITPIKTDPITEKDTSITALIDQYITDMPEESILVVASKIVAIAEGCIVPEGTVEKEDLVPQYADQYIPKELNALGFTLTITNNKLVASAGIDASNSNGNFVLWPKNAQHSANTIREYITKKFNRKHLGVLITDSHTMPLMWGVIGFSLAHSGFRATLNYIGKPDIFGKTMQVTHQSHTEGLAAAADVVMGGADECQPFARITDVPFVQFQDRNPTEEELDSIKVEPETDIYWPVLKNAPWKKGKR
jgi:F420-0:gamma-glutamyl ligase